MTASRRTLRVVGFATLLVVECGLVVYTARLFGASIESGLRHRWAHFWLVDFLFWVALFVAMLVLRSRGLHRLFRRHVLWVASGTLLFLAGAILLVGPAVNLRWHYVPELHISVYPPSRTDHPCVTGWHCWTRSIDEFGLRNAARRPRAARAPALAVLGDSFVFGVGLDDADALPAQLERALAAETPGLRVINAGLPGLSLASYPAMARYAIARYGADRLLVLLNCTDVVLFDFNAHENRIRDSMLWRLLTVLDLDALVDVATMMSIPVRPDRATAAALRERLDDLAEAAGGRPLLVVSDWLPPYTALLAAWFERHPEVGWLNVRGNPAWAAAETIPRDPHWSAHGTAAIAGLLRPAVRDLLGRPPVAMPCRAPCAPPRPGVRIGPRPPLDLAFLRSPDITLRTEPGDPSIRYLDLALGDLGTVGLRATWCGTEPAAYRAGRVCFSVPGTMHHGQDQALTRWLDARRAELEALRPAASWMDPAAPTGTGPATP